MPTFSLTSLRHIAVIIIGGVLALAVSLGPAAAHTVNISIYPGTSSYVTGHQVEGDSECYGAWNQNLTESVTEYNVNSVRFNSAKLYVYNLIGDATGGPYVVVDSVNSTSKTYTFFTHALYSGNTYGPWNVGFSVGSADQLWPYTKLTVYPGGTVGGACVWTDFVRYVPH